MRQFVVIFIFVLAMTLVLCADRRSALQGGARAPQSRQQSSEGQSEEGDPENASAMTNKVNECRSILQQAGMLNLGDGGAKTTEGQTENETEEPKGTDSKNEEEPMGAAPPRRGGRRH